MVQTEKFEFLWVQAAQSLRLLITLQQKDLTQILQCQVARWVFLPRYALTNRTLECFFPSPPSPEADFTEAVATGKKNWIFKDITAHGTVEVGLWSGGHFLSEWSQKHNKQVAKSVSLNSIAILPVGISLRLQYSSLAPCTTTPLRCRLCLVRLLPVET